MIAVKVCFADPRYDYVTDINGTLESATAYFVGAALNFGDRDWGDCDNMQVVTRVELVA